MSEELIVKRGCFICGYPSPGGGSWEKDNQRGKICTLCMHFIELGKYTPEQLEAKFLKYDDSNWQPPENYN